MGSNYGVWLDSAGTFNCQGTATSPNYIVRYNTVQEQSNTNWETTDWQYSFESTPSDETSTSANFRFTEWSVLGADEQFDTYGLNVLPVSFQDCQFYNGAIDAVAQTLFSTNCLFQRVNMWLGS